MLGAPKEQGAENTSCALNLSGTKDSKSGSKALVQEYLYESRRSWCRFTGCNFRLFFA